VALKVLPPQSTARPGFTERFNREARAMARLNHPNIVALHEFGQVGGMPYFVMEYVEGVTLRRLVQARRLEPREALKIVPQICEALQFAHDEGVIHRDIKPENILLDKKGRVKIADFGIAKIMGGVAHSAPSPGLTATRSPSDGEKGPARDEVLTQGQVLGTPNYMAPEQVDHPQAVDHRADIYSLGVVFYEMLTGELPLGKFAPPSQKVQVDVRLDEVVLHALEKEPERRYQQASQVKTAVETIATTPLPTPPPIAPTQSLKDDAAIERARRLVRWPAIGLITTSVISPLLLGGMVVSGRLKAGEWMLFPLIFELALVVVTALGGFKLLDLESRWMAVTGGIAGCALSFFNFFCLPFAAWALAVSSRREVREAFRANRARPLPEGTGAAGIASSTVSTAEREGRHPPTVRVAAASNAGTFGAASRRVVLRLALVLVIHLVLLEALDQASVHWKESTGEVWGMALMGGSCIALVWAFWPGFRSPRWRVLGASGAIVSCFMLWGIDYFYNWHLRPNLGLYQEEDWVAQHPAFQRQLRQRIQNNLWHPPAPAQLATDSSKPGRVHRKFVRLVADQEAITFQGQPTTWDNVGALLEKVKDRTNTVLEYAVTSDQITVQQQNEWMYKCRDLASAYGFEYASFVGIHELGSKGTAPPD
jgi:hypothetical protein